MYCRVTVNKTCDQILCMAMQCMHTYTTNTCCCFHFSLLGIAYTASVCCLNLYKYHMGREWWGGVSCWPARTVAGVCTNKFLACIFVVLVHDMHRVCADFAVHQRPLYINSSNNNSQLLILPLELKPREREREMSQWWN